MRIGSEQQEGTEDVEHPVEPFDQGDAGEDEDRPHHQRAEDAPEQHPMLVARRHLEVAHDQRPHKHVVDAEALLDQVARQVLGGRLTRRTTTAPPTRTTADRDPHRGFDRRLFGLDLVRLRWTTSRSTSRRTTNIPSRASHCQSWTLRSTKLPAPLSAAIAASGSPCSFIGRLGPSGAVTSSRNRSRR